MLRRLALALGLVLAPATAQAVSFTGPLITSLITDHARYIPGELVVIPAAMTNNTGAAIPTGGSLSCQMSGRGVAVNGPSVAALPALAVGASATVTVTLPTSTFFDFRGYLVACTAKASGGQVYDMETTAVDVSSDWSRYARECMVTHHGIPGTDVAGELRGLRAYHCSVGQYMDVYHKIHQPYSPLPTWTRLENDVQMSAQALRAYMAEANRSRLASFLFLDWAAAGGEFQTDGSGVSMSWGLFSTACSPSCTLSNLVQHSFPPSWSETALVDMDPTNPAWQNYWISTTKPMVDHFGFQGCQIDTLGDMNQTAYNAAGGLVNYASAASGFTNYALGKACRRGTYNNVSTILAQDQIQNGTEDFFYSERHPEFGDAPSFVNMHDSTGVIRAWNPNKAINYAVYINECLGQLGSGGASPNCSATTAAHCSTVGGPDTCYFNEPGLRLSNAVILASGAWNNNFIDGYAPSDDPLFISNIFAVNPLIQLSARPSTKQAMLDYTTFAVANEKILRDQAIDVNGTYPASVTSGACSSATTGAPGTVYMIDRARPGLETVSLINLCNQTVVDSQDRYGNEVSPATYTNVVVKMYYGGSLSASGAGSVGGGNKLWVGSPDAAHGVPANVSYTKGSDGGGNFVTFTIPSLQYWTMAFLELDSLATSDYAFQ